MISLIQAPVPHVSAPKKVTQSEDVFALPLFQHHHFLEDMYSYVSIDGELVDFD